MMFTNMDRRNFLIIVLVILMVVSICIISNLVFRLNATVSVVGTYCDHNSHIYIILDKQGRYCRYQPPATVFEVGTYEQIAERQYALYDSETSSRYTALLFQKSLFFVYDASTVVELEKISDVPYYDTVSVLLEP